MTFAVIWIGQFLSATGSGLTGFGLGVWIYQDTGSVSLFAWISIAAVLPGLLALPFAGALVDRWERRRAMIVSDLGAGLATLGLAAMIFVDWRPLWAVCLLIALSSMFSAFQWPAFSATITLLVPREHLGRANGLGMLVQAAPRILSPILAGALFDQIHLGGIILIDVGTFLIAVTILLAVRLPTAEASAEGSAAASSFLREALYGFTYIRERPGLMGLLALSAILNFNLGALQVLIPPLILSFSSPAVLGTVQTVGGVGVIAGSVVMSVWGGPRRKVNGVFVVLLLQGAILTLGGLRPSATLIAAVGFLFLSGMPVIMGCGSAIWQSKVPADLQGRVFAVRQMLGISTVPLAYGLAAPLVDHVFEPLMAADGALASSLGQLIGVGPGRGVALNIILMGLAVIAAVAVISGRERVRRVEDLLPDALPES